MQKVTVALLLVFGLSVGSLYAQTEYSFDVATTVDLDMAFPIPQSGVRTIAGPYDLDNDGLYELLVSDYTGGGRVHVLENAGIDTWEHVYSTPVLDSTGSTNNIRAITGGDLDGDGAGEIIFFAGRDYSATNPNIGDLPPGLYFFEHTGSDDDYGMAAAAIYEFPGDLPDRWRTEQFQVADVDGDGADEIMFGNNGSANNYDSWYVVSVTGDIGSSFETFVEEARWTSRALDPDTVARGGGSAYGIVPADLDGSGDGLMELSMQSWNSFNFTNAAATGANTYEAAAFGDTLGWYQAGPGDHVSLFSGTAVDINGDGDDEVFWPRFQSFGDGAVSLLNYESGENVLQVTPDNLLLDFLSPLTNFGIVAGDVTGDGNPDLIGAGASYTGADADAAAPSSWVRVAAWVGPIGGDPEDINNYSLRTFDTSAPVDTTHLSTVFRDSAGVMTQYRETADGKFATKLAYLGDADMDGVAEVAVGFQSVPDSIQIIDEVWNADSTRYDRTVRETSAAPAREFVRILSAGNFNVSVEDTRIITPDDYKLEANYPNPFNGETTIGFELPLDKEISLKVYDVTGRLVNTLINDERYPKGLHRVTWDGKTAGGAAAASGTYFYTLEYGNFRKSRQMVLVK